VDALDYSGGSRASPNICYGDILSRLSLTTSLKMVSPLMHNTPHPVRYFDSLDKTYGEIGKSLGGVMGLKTPLTTRDNSEARSRLFAG
jgi:hypothetical protein